MGYSVIAIRDIAEDYEFYAPRHLDRVQHEIPPPNVCSEETPISRLLEPVGEYRGGGEGNPCRFDLFCKRNCRPEEESVPKRILLGGPTKSSSADRRQRANVMRWMLNKAFLEVG